MLNEKSFGYALKENGRVISALVVRAAVSRFSRGRVGFVWILLEPAVLLAIFLGIHTLTQLRVPFGDDPLLFMMAGVFGFRMTRGTSATAEQAIASNLPMLSYPLVRPLDTIIASFLLESTIWLIICGLFMGGLSLTTDEPVIVHPDKFAECLMAILFFSFSFATFNATVGALIPRYDIVLNLSSMPLMLLSGAFFMPTQLPPEIQAILWWNPFLHCVEWFRTSTYLDYTPLLDREYLLGLSVGLLATGLTVERVFRGKIISAQ